MRFTLLSFSFLVSFFYFQRVYFYILQWLYNLRVASVSYELWVAILRKWIYGLRVPFYELKSNFPGSKFVLWVGSKTMSCKLLFASCELISTSCKFKKIILRVASCVLWVESSKNLFYKLPIAFYELKMINLRVAKLPFTS